MRARLDQHFLADPSVADRIVGAARIEPGERVLEIGPGQGILTERLLAAGARIIGIEIDEALYAALEERWRSEPRLRLLHKDFLEADLSSLPNPCKIVSNLPYSMGTQILQRVLPWAGWSSAVLMFQKEVADRIRAEPGGRDYGVLSVSAAIHAEAELLFDVPRLAFRPPPKVESAVLHLRRLPRCRLPEGLREEHFFKVVRAAFAQRRKMAANSLAASLRLERGDMAAAMRSAGIDPELRAERIPIEGFSRLAERLAPLL